MQGQRQGKEGRGFGCETASEASDDGAIDLDEERTQAGIAAAIPPGGSAFPSTERDVLKSRPSWVVRKQGPRRGAKARADDSASSGADDSASSGADGRKKLVVAASAAESERRPSWVVRKQSASCRSSDSGGTDGSAAEARASDSSALPEPGKPTSVSSLQLDADVSMPDLTPGQDPQGHASFAAAARRDDLVLRDSAGGSMVSEGSPVPPASEGSMVPEGFSRRLLHTGWRGAVRAIPGAYRIPGVGERTGTEALTSTASVTLSAASLPQREIVVEVAHLAPEETSRQRSLAAAPVIVLRDGGGSSMVVEGVPVPTREDRSRRDAETAGLRWGRLSRRNRMIAAAALASTVAAIVLAVVLSRPTPHAESPVKATAEQLSSPEALEDPTSPQSRALRWITEEDGLTVSLSDESHLLQRYALAVFFYSTGGITSWMDRFGFLSNEHECEWWAESGIEQQRGVMCNDRKEVVGIYLDNNNLLGTLPGPELGAFPSLSHLQLASNRLQGSLPEELARLFSLRQISMRNNSLGGALMEDIGNLRSLEALELGLNKKLTSTIPSSIGNLQMLKVLDLEENQISGAFPSSMGNMSSLHDIYLGRNRLTSTIPSEWNNLAQLKYFTAPDNDLTGTLPVHPFRLQNLTTLVLYGNRLTGMISSSLGTLPKLQVLLLMYNQFHGPIPVSLTNLTEFRTLGLLNNSLTGTIPPRIFEIESLQWLELGDNHFTGSIPNNVGNPSMMLGLGLEKNQLTGTIPSSLGNHPSLMGLDLHSNILSGTIPSSLGENFWLYILSLENNILAGVVPESLQRLERIQWLSVARNNLTGSLDQICAMEGSSYRQITADCTEPGAEVSCDCCRHCCNDAVGECDYHYPTDISIRKCIAEGTCPNIL